MYDKKNGVEWNQYETMSDLLQNSCERYAKRVAFSWKKGRKTIEKTYEEWERDLLLTAGKISKMKEKHIGIVSDISYEAMVSLFAIIIAGKVAVPLEADQSKALYEKHIEKADIELILYRVSTMGEQPDNCSLLQFQELFSMEGERFLEWPKWESDRAACIFFSSGTSGDFGEKKCVLLSQLNIVTTCAVFHMREFYRRTTETLLFLPFYHVQAFSGIVACIEGGYKTFLGKGPKYLTVDLLEAQPDFIMSVPQVSELLMKGIQKGIKSSGKEADVEKGLRLTKALWKYKIDLRPTVFQDIYKGLGGHLRVMTVGGAPISTDIIDYFEGFGIYLLTGYGMTETAGAVAQNTLRRLRPGSVGIVFPYNEVKIVDGEIWIRGNNVMLGYYKDEEATKHVMEDGWLKTGDLGYLDEDGYLFITGRKKNLIILSNGVNVSPEEVEKELLKSELIQEVVVCEKDGHIHARIYPGELSKEAEKVIQAQIAEEIKNYNYENSVYNRIVSWELRTAPFEKTSNLKIKRNV